ncbi:ribulokinase [Okibacterium endophyticum]
MRESTWLAAGVDYGTDSVRVTVLDASSGTTVMTVSRPYPRWSAGEYCDPKSGRFRQHPLDHLETLEACFAEIGDRLGDCAIRALAIDTTGSTPVPVDRHGVPLALLDEFADEPDAMFWLWKDRTSTEEAGVIDHALSTADPDHTMFQGVYSSEWWWAKILRATTINERIRAHAYSWVEHSDWLPNMLVGVQDVNQFSRNACAAGHKVLYSERLGGMIAADVLAGIDSYLAEVRETFQTPPVPAGTRLGTLCPAWAERLRLSTETVVGAGSLDAHAGGVGAGIDARSLVKVMGTSTVDLFLTDYESIEGADLRRVCGIAEDSIVPGYLGGETSQAAFGDLFAWYARMLAWPIHNVVASQLRAVMPEAEVAALSTRTSDAMLSALEAEVLLREPGDIVALDWINGRRYPDVDEDASAALVGLRIGHDAVDIYRALVEAAVLGSKAIYDGLSAAGVRFERVILVGGIARKSPLICQSIADALNTEVLVCEEHEVCALGAAMYAATAAGFFAGLPAAQEHLRGGFAARYTPSPEDVARFEAAFDRYRAAGRLVGEFGDALGVRPNVGGH